MLSTLMIVRVNIFVCFFEKLQMCLVLCSLQVSSHLLSGRSYFINGEMETERNQVTFLRPHS